MLFATHLCDTKTLKCVTDYNLLHNLQHNKMCHFSDVPNFSDTFEKCITQFATQNKNIISFIAIHGSFETIFVIKFATICDMFLGHRLCGANCVANV